MCDIIMIESKEEQPKGKEEKNMTVNEIFKFKYEAMLKTMNSTAWRNFKFRAEYEKKHIAELMYMAIEITEFDIRENGGYKGELYEEIKQMHEAKLLASNKHRNEHGHVDRWWLTPKGFKYINKDGCIC